MGYMISIILTPVILALLWTPQVKCSVQCARICDQGSNKFVCNQSRILISDVTNMKLEKKTFSLENVKRDCMGRTSCDTSRFCSSGNAEILLVHYLCVNANQIYSKSCNRDSLKVEGDLGYIQSPGYPAVMRYNAYCNWMIEPPSGSVVLLFLHDIAIKNSEGSKGGLVISGEPCTGEETVSYINGNDNITSLTRCGNVDIRLIRQYDIRFWLEFHILQKDRVASFQKPVQHCSILNYDAPHGSKSSDKEASQDSNTEVLVIMLSVISGISAVLLIMLIIVCIRCRLNQVSHAEAVSSIPTPSAPAYYEYISTSEPEKARPQLADGYFEVADSVPFNQRAPTPTVPAYAEVEHAADSSSSCEYSRVHVILNEEKQSAGELQNKTAKQTDTSISYVNSEHSQPKHRTLGRLKGERSKQAIKERKSLEHISNKDSADLHGSHNLDDDAFSGYEPVEKRSFVKVCSDINKSLPVLGGHPSCRKLSADNVLLNKNSNIIQREYEIVRDKTKVHPKANSAALPQTSGTVSSVINTFNKTGNLNKNVSSYVSDGTKTLPSRNCKSWIKTVEMNNTDYKHSVYREMPRSSGMVRNEIKKFEQSSA